MSNHSYGTQIAALAAASVWPLLAIGLAFGSRISESIPNAVRAKIARRGPKPVFTQKRLEQARVSK